MKIFSSAPQDKSSRAYARNCLLINQFATPGLGSLMAGRILAGTFQLTLAVAGFVMVVVGILQKTNDLYRQAVELPTQGQHLPWLTPTGFSLFAASWVFAWLTSLDLLRRARPDEPAAAAPPEKDIPPIIQPPIIKL